MNAYVNQERCIGCGACVAICSAVYQLNNEGKAYADNANIDGFTELGTQDAAANCPVDAIKVS